MTFSPCSQIPANQSFPRPTDLLLPTAHASGWLYIGGSFDTVNGLPKTFLARLRLDGTNPRLAAPAPDSDQVRLTLYGFPGIYALESSVDLKTWEPLATVTNLTGRLQFTNADAAAPSTRFYRAVVK